MMFLVITGLIFVHISIIVILDNVLFSSLNTIELVNLGRFENLWMLILFVLGIALITLALWVMSQANIETLFLDKNKSEIIITGKKGIFLRNYEERFRFSEIKGIRRIHKSTGQEADSLYSIYLVFHSGREKFINMATKDWSDEFTSKLQPLLNLSLLTYADMPSKNLSIN